MRYSMDLDAATARALFTYNPDTGVVSRRSSRGGMFAGTPVGTDNGHGYLSVLVNRRRYLVHRLAWLISYGEFPAEQIDHINCVRDDNRLCNLRAATSTENHVNAPRTKRNKNGYKGISFIARDGKWMARTSKNRQFIYLGTYDTQEEAHAAYVAGAARTHGDFVRAQ